MNSPFFTTPIPFVKDIDQIIRDHPTTRERLRELVNGNVVIDLGSGVDEESKAWQNLCVDLQAYKYIGIDIQVKASTTSTYASTTIQIFQTDLLKFMKNYDTQKKRQIFTFWGMEIVNPKKESSQNYMNKLMKSIYKKAMFDDIILIGNGTHGLKPTKHGFDKLSALKFNKFFIKQYVKKA